MKLNQIHKPGNPNMETEDLSLDLHQAHPQKSNPQPNPKKSKIDTNPVT